MDSREKKILSAVDSLSDDILDLTCRLVRQPSTLGNEACAMKVMEGELKNIGLSPHRVAMDSDVLKKHPGFAPVPWSMEGRYNLAAVREADASDGRSLLLNGHLDVVSPEPREFWDSDPFSAEIREGWIYGRGAGDMKSGVAAMTYALHAVEKAGLGLRAPVTLEAVIEEECSGNGALACMASGYDADAVLIPEPFGSTVYIAQVGVLWFKVSLRGVSGHVLNTAAGKNAIEKISPIIDALRRLEAAMNKEKRPPAYQDIPHPLNLNIGIIKGGDWPSSVPSAAEFHGRLSFFPGTSYESVCSRIRSAIAEAAESDAWLAGNPPKVEFYGFRSEGHTIDPALPPLATLNECHRDLNGRDTESYVSTCTTDLRVFQFFGRAQGTCYGPVAENIHGANERVEIESILRTARTYSLFIARWCGLVE